ncbi:MAG: four helix bundle protein [Candidatus Buchananbacteria bacterium RBG_13_36_9]|uniref:Four helix bundle protein n=1 Tax=Candidatus Buchananbacteria bacterium RBG_13_36_9 TaxID=1797530 RepID=A0A1G1XQ18_9BACT|nr:MAG: four helix bundle protein [Candidatus Buchananbacteria bacterium RBG_13_36_9]
MEKIEKIEDLRVWQKAHELAILTYKITANFPDNEKYGLVSQMRRCCVSVPSNIAEAFRRRGKDKFVFYSYADASLEELRYQFLLSHELKYLNNEDYNTAKRLASETGGMLNRWVKSLKK